MKFDTAVSNILNEAPFGDVGQIRSQKFTREIPDRAKFRRGDLVRIGYADYPGLNSIRNKFGRDATGYVVGMQRNTGPGHSRSVMGNRYYVEFDEGEIYPISSMHLTHAD